MAEPTYTLLTLDDQASSDFNELLGINDAGTAVGYFGTGVSPDPFPTAVELAAPYAAADYQTIGQTGAYTVSGASTEAYAINNLGTIDGSGRASPTGGFTAVTFGQGSTATAGTVKGFSGGVAVLGVNDAGAVVGYSGSGTVTSAVVVLAGTSDTLPVFSTSTVAATVHGAPTIRPLEATGINDADIITGFGTVSSGATEGFIYNEVTGSVATLTGPNGGTFTEALGLNNEGQVVGEYKDSAGALHGFVYDIASARYTTIDATGSSTVPVTSTVVNGINDLGEIVGSYVEGGVTHGLLGYVPGSAATVAAPVAGSTIEVPAGYSSVAVGGATRVTLLDPGVGHVALFANTGGDVIDAFGAADTVVGGSGGDTVSTTGTGDVVFLGGGANSVVATALATIVANGTADSVTVSGGGLIFEAGAGSLTANGGAASGGPTTIVGGAGALDAYAGDAAGNLVFAGSGASTLSGGLGQSTLIGGSGPATIYAGAGGGLIFGGTGDGFYAASGAANAAPTFMAVGQGNGDNTVVAAAGSTVFLTGSGSALVADLGTSTAAGVATLVGGGSGNTTFFLGASSDLVFAGAGTTNISFDDKGAGTIVGGSGKDIYTFAPSVSGGVYTVYDFKQGTDLIELGGASAAKTDLAGASFVNGNTRLTLSTNGDTAKITFIGVHLTASDFG